MLSRHIRDKKPSDSIRRRASVPSRPIRCLKHDETKKLGRIPEKAGWKGGKGAFPNCTDPIIPDFPTGYSGFSAAEEYAGRRWKNCDSMGGGGREGKKRIVASANCGLSLFFFFSRGRKLEEKYSARKIKVKESPLLLSCLLRRTKDFCFYKEKMLEGLNLFCNLNGIVIKSREKEGGEAREKTRRSWQARLSTNRIVVTNECNFLNSYFSSTLEYSRVHVSFLQLEIFFIKPTLFIIVLERLRYTLVAIQCFNSLYLNLLCSSLDFN